MYLSSVSPNDDVLQNYSTFHSKILTLFQSKYRTFQQHKDPVALSQAHTLPSHLHTQLTLQQLLVFSPVLQCCHFRNVTYTQHTIFGDWLFFSPMCLSGASPKLLYVLTNRSLLLRGTSWHRGTTVCLNFTYGSTSELFSVSCYYKQNCYKCLRTGCYTSMSSFPWDEFPGKQLRDCMQLPVS